MNKLTWTARATQRKHALKVKNQKKFFQKNKTKQKPENGWEL